MTTAGLAESLADAMAKAYGHSGLLQQNRALLRAADEDVAQAVAALRPIVNWSADITRSFSDGSVNSATTDASVGVSLNWLLYDFGRSAAGIEAQKQSVLATRQSLVSVEQQILLNAVQAYMSVRRDSQIVALRQNNLRLITRELRAARDRFEVGEVTRTDVALAEARLAGARAELAVAQGNLMASREFYAAVVGRQPGTLSAPARLPSTARTLDQAKAVAVRSHPDMRAAQYQVAAAEFGVRQASAAMKPQVNMSAGLSATERFNSSYEVTGGRIGVGASGPIYQGGRLSSLARQAMARRDAARGALHATQYRLQQNVGSAWAQLAAARAQSEASARQIRAARIAFDGVREEASLGARTTLDVLNAEQELLNAQSNQISARTSEFTAAYTLLAAMGLLTVDHLNLAVEKYDPEAYYKAVESAPALKSKQGQQLDKVLRRLGKE
ncbi:TolC family outer membrane protein [Cognatishimia sp. SS12]|uniref:TolC family outer membrane protein n=1 Tax=Cognatishimia sp. SS12 TaxID=2979465 RepID=UPI00232B72EA|nr:TolC family outer membrane protein [Cognatishimia sp. SS12]